MRSYTLLTLVSLVSLVACDIGTDVFDEPRIYAFDLVEAQTGTPALTVADCEAAQPDPGGLFVNCWQTLTLCPDGRAELMVTDIVNGGRYRVDGASLVVTFTGPSEVGPRATFRLADDRQSAVYEATGETWVLWDADDERAASVEFACG